jgi:DHA2 family methylenomycin A resistance protein-like MFS transporter
MVPLITLAIGFVMAMIDVTAVNVALPAIARTLGVPLTGLVWVVDAYTLTFASLILAGGALADRFGAKVAYQVGLAVFVLGSVLCGAAPAGGILIISRLVQGAGAALFMPSSLSLLMHQYEDPKTRSSMLSIWSAMVGAAAAIGPLVGGILIHSFGWRSVFWINVPVGLLGALLAQLYIRPVAAKPAPLSVQAHGLSVLSLASISFVLIEGPTRGWVSTSIIAVAAVAVVAVLRIVRLERKGSHPIIPHELLRVSGFGALNLAGFLNNFAGFGQLFLLGLYFQDGRAVNALQAGFLLLPTMAAITAGNLLSSSVSNRIGVRKTMIFGWVIAAFAALATQVSANDASYFALVLICSILCLALGFAIPAMTATMMQMAGKSYANSAAAALNANRQIGALVGVAIVGTIMHVIPQWSERLHVAFGLFFVAYGIASFMVYRFIPLPPGLPSATRSVKTA